MDKWGGVRQNTTPFLITSDSNAEWETNINFIKSFVKDRPTALRKEMMEYFNLKDTINLKLDVNDKKAGKICLMGYTLDGGDFDGYIFADIPIRIEAIPHEGYEFVKWKGAEYDQDCLISLNRKKKLTAVFQKIE